MKTNTELRTRRNAAPPTEWESLLERRGKTQLVMVGVSGLTGAILRPLESFRTALERGGGVPAESISILKTGFSRPFTENAEALARQLPELRQRSGRRLVVFGNPTTSVDLLLAVLKHPELLRDGVVEKMVLMQPAFGTPLLKGASKVVGGVLGKNDPTAVKALFQEALARFPEELRPLLDARVGYVRTGASGRDLNPFLKISSWLIGGEDDGVSRTVEQQLPGVGSDLVEPLHNVDHWDTTARFTSLSKKQRDAFAKLLLGAL